MMAGPDLSLTDKPLAEPCLVWPRWKTVAGYGVIFRGRRRPDGKRGKREYIYVHRQAAADHIGVPLDVIDGFEVRHRCDNPSCFRASHLVLGTHEDNMRDMQRRGRARGNESAGEESAQAKLTEAQVAEIRLAFVKGCPEAGGEALGRKYGVDATSIRNIINGKTWAKGEVVHGRA